MDFEELLKNLSPKLRALTKSLNTNNNSLDSEDLYQEALLFLWQEYLKGGLSEKTESYILKSCHFFLKNFLRKANKKLDMLSKSLDEHMGKSTLPRNDLTFIRDSKLQLQRRELKILIDEIQNFLNKTESIVFSLILEGFTTREIGRKLGLSHVMIVKIKKRIREKCRLFEEEVI